MLLPTCSSASLFGQPSGSSLVLVHQANYAFKPTAGEVCRSNQPLSAGGGLTRR
jgi:hypothetical protein